MLQVWLRFIICAAVIFFAGSRLSKYGDIIAEKLGLTRAWIGLVLLATITSVPELANSIGAVTYVNAPDLAVGDLFGACLFNMNFAVFIKIRILLKRKKAKPAIPPTTDRK